MSRTFALLIVFALLASGCIGVQQTLPPPPTVAASPQAPEASPTAPPAATEPPTATTAEPPPAATATEPAPQPTAARPSFTPAPVVLTLTYDLLFIANSQLIRWQAAKSAFQSLLDGHVTHFVADPAGAFAVVARLSSGSSVEIVRVDLAGGAPAVLATVDGADAPWLALSPDGQWLAFVAGPNSSFGDVRSGQVFVMPAQPGGELRHVGECMLSNEEIYTVGCLGLLWAPDGHTLVWGDGPGVWLVDAEGGEPRQVLASGPGQPDDPTAGAHAPVAWSPQGRFLTVRIGYYEGSGFGVLDVQTGRIAEIPGAGEYMEPTARMAWLPNGRLVVVMRSDPQAQQTPHIDMWRIDPESEALLVNGGGGLIDVPADMFPLGTTVLDDGRMAFALIGSNMNGPRTTMGSLYVTQLNEMEQANPVADLPPARTEETYVDQVWWSPDGAGALVVYNDDLAFLPADGGAQIDLGVWSGGGGVFAWVRGR
jgi:dipeptidyl aminopeptidase/acylaminoacyl peptidase